MARYLFWSSYTALARYLSLKPQFCASTNCFGLLPLPPPLLCLKTPPPHTSSCLPLLQALPLPLHLLGQPWYQPCFTSLGMEPSGSLWTFSNHCGILLLLDCNCSNLHLHRLLWPAAPSSVSYPKPPTLLFLKPQALPLLPKLKLKHLLKLHCN